MKKTKNQKEKKAAGEKENLLYSFFLALRCRIGKISFGSAKKSETFNNIGYGI